MNLKSLWHKQIFSSKPWVEVTVVDGKPIVTDYNQAFIDEQRRKAGVVGAVEEELVEFFLNPDFFAAKVREAERIAAEEAARIAEEEAQKQPKVELGYEDGKMVVKSYNQAFVEEQRKLLGDLAEGRSDEQVIQLFLDRDALDKEEPRLDVVHMGIEADGKVKVQLDWNRAFIKHLRDNGITADTEDEAVQKYLTMLTLNELQGELEPEEFYSKEQLEAAFGELDKQLEAELEEAKKPKRRRRMVK